MRYTDIFDKIVEEGNITISLLLTLQCNMKCGHCMYMCGPNSPKGYMSDDILRKVKYQVDELQELGIHPSINLIGGEPTLNMKEFERIFQRVMTWDVQVEMTTNGWWLDYKHEKWAKEFFRIIAENVNGYGIDEGFTVRISNDRWHQEFRQIANPIHRLSSLWDEIFYTEIWECLDCLEDEITLTDDYKCPHCGSEAVDSRWEEPNFMIPPEPNPDYPWIYVEARDKYEIGPVPTGRANSFGSNDHGVRFPGRCAGYFLSYTPNGTLTDICCLGSWTEFGTVDDHPMLLLALGQKFVNEVEPTCHACRIETTYYKKHNLANRRKSINRALYKWLDEVHYQ